MAKKLSYLFVLLIAAVTVLSPDTSKANDANPSQPSAAVAQNPAGTAPTYKAGETFRDCANCPEMVVIPAGDFLMGTSQADMDRDLKGVPVGKGTTWVTSPAIAAAARMKDEMPQHQVHIAQPFGLGKYPVTRGEFAAFVQETGHKTKGGCALNVLYPRDKIKEVPEAGWQNPGFDQTDRDPVVCVSVHDVEAYVAWLNAKVKNPASAKETGPYRLPSEAEWEYAARAGTRTAYWWGDSIGFNNAVCHGCGSLWDNRQPAPVGDKQPVLTDGYHPNPFGLYDVHGNVWELTEDCWNKNYSGAPSDGSAWKTGDCGERAMRGGSWDSDPWMLRSAFRGGSDIDTMADRLGFRLARTLQ